MTAFGPAYFRDPHPRLKRLRDEQPVVFNRALGRWIVTRHDDALAVLRDAGRFSSSVVPQVPPGEGGPALDRFRQLSARWLFFLDPPRHAPERAPLARALAPAAVKVWEPDIRAAAAALLERKPGPIDAVADYAHPLAVHAIAGLIGSTPAARARLAPACVAMEAAGRDHGHRPTWERGLQGIAAATAAVDAIVDEVVGGGAEPTPVLAELLRARRSGVLDRDGVCAHLLVLLFAGVETTQNLVANAVHTLLRHPRVLAGLRDGVPPSDRVVEECLRFEPPVFGVLRRARVPVTLRGQALRAGDEVVVMLAAANRDGDRFPDAQRFLPARAENAHLTFGFGPHYCPGAALATATTRLALEVLAAHGPRRPSGAPAVRWRDHDPIVRGPKELPIDLAVQ